MQAIRQGNDFPDHDVIDVLELSEDLALAITRGLHPKPYAYVDPNEDCVAVAVGPDATLLVVADGHNGHQASHAAVEFVLERLGANPPPSISKHDVAMLIHEVNDHIRDVRRSLHGPVGSTRTTLVLALLQHPVEDRPRVLTYASVGDSVVVLAGDAGVARLTEDRNRFLGDRWSPPEIAGLLDHGVVELNADDIVMAVSDGATNFLSLTEIGQAMIADPAAGAGACARRVIVAANDAGAGDNVAAAVIMPAHP